jgi:hypothetical protein
LRAGILRQLAGFGVVAWAIGHVGTLAALADTLPGALIQAYVNNPQLNSQRAVVRATDEGVPQALSGYKPRVTANGSVGQQYTTGVSKTLGRPGRSRLTFDRHAELSPSRGWLHAEQVIAHAFSGKGWPLRVRRMACSAPMARRLAVSRTDRMSA